MSLSPNSANRRYLESKGINLLGGFSTEAGEFDTILQNCRSVVVMANGGSLLFEEFVKDLKANTHFLTSSDHPFDAFIKRTIEKIPNQKTLLEDRSHENRWVMCSQASSIKINFMELAQRAGIGLQSHLGILINPHYGLWIGLRAALFSTKTLDEIGFVEGTAIRRPCDDCSKPCISSCHYQAVTALGWDMKTCAKAHLLDDRRSLDPHSKCFASCDSRRACPIGMDYQHSELQHKYHYNRPIGRNMLAKILGVEDHRKGDGPYWGRVFT